MWQMTGQIMNSIMVDDLDKVTDTVEKPGGKIAVPGMEIRGVGWTVIIPDTEGKALGVWQPWIR